LAEWDTAYINDLPDSAFACIDSGGEKEDGKTVPRTLRHYPHHNAAGEVDLPHLRNALSRIAQGGTADCGQEHLEAHAESQEVGNRTEEIDTTVQIRSMTKREVDVRIVPWDTPIQTIQGLEMFARGAFEGTDPNKVLLMGMEHEAHLGLGQGGAPRLTRRPIGKGRSLDDRKDGGHMTFRVAPTPAGDEFLTLAQEGIVDGVSMEFDDVPGGTEVQTINGRRVNYQRRVKLNAVSPTYQPAYAEARVLAVRSHEGDAAMAEDEATAVVAEEAPVPAPVYDFSEFGRAVGSMNTGLERITDRLTAMEERFRSNFTVPSPQADIPQANIGTWAGVVLRLLSGESVPQGELHARAVQDLITTDNAGVVPEAYISELRGVIDPARPFMESTRRLPVPSSGTTMRVPKITQRPTVALQDPEKEELSSQKTIIGSDTFDMVSKGGVGDISLQLLKRSDPSFLDLYVRLLAEAYAIEAEDEALRALFDATGGVGTADPLDPEDLSLGAAFQASFDEIRRPPDTIWLSTQAVAEFIDAKATTTNQPLYGTLQTSATAAGGITGTISGLRAVHVPGLDSHGAYAIVGPSSGFAWAEDGTYTLQVDVPAKAGRDVAIFGMLWFIPWYPDAFTLYNVAS
jgi:phage head maturation protease